MTLILAVIPTELAEGRRNYQGTWVYRENLRVLFTDSPIHHPPSPYPMPKQYRRERRKETGSPHYFLAASF